MLELKLDCNNKGYTIVNHQYSAYPLGISRTFRTDGDNGAHLYITSTSPGLLANDHLKISLQLGALTQLYLREQSATKVHPMPNPGSKATVSYDIEIGEGAILEFISEPIILFKEANFEQTTRIKYHPGGRLFWSEIIVPGRLARGEFYEFNTYYNRLEVTSPEGELFCRDAIRLEGKQNLFKNSALFAPFPIFGNVIILLPLTNFSLLGEQLEDLEAANCFGVKVASSLLPYNKGLVIKAIASGTHELKNYINYALKIVQNYD